MRFAQRFDTERKFAMGSKSRSTGLHGGNAYLVIHACKSYDPIPDLLLRPNAAEESLVRQLTTEMPRSMAGIDGIKTRIDVYVQSRPDERL